MSKGTAPIRRIPNRESGGLCPALPVPDNEPAGRTAGNQGFQFVK